MQNSKTHKKTSKEVFKNTIALVGVICIAVMLFMPAAVCMVHTEHELENDGVCRYMRTPECLCDTDSIQSRFSIFAEYKTIKLFDLNHDNEIFNDCHVCVLMQKTGSLLKISCAVANSSIHEDIFLCLQESLHSSSMQSFMLTPVELKIKQMN